MDIGEERKEIIVVPMEDPSEREPILDPEPARAPEPVSPEPTKEPVKEPVGV